MKDLKYDLLCSFIISISSNSGFLSDLGSHFVLSSLDEAIPRGMTIRRKDQKEVEEDVDTNRTTAATRLEEHCQGLKYKGFERSKETHSPEGISEGSP